MERSIELATTRPSKAVNIREDSNCLGFRGQERAGEPESLSQKGVKHDCGQNVEEAKTECV